MPCQWGCNAAITACALGIQWEKALLLLFEWQNLGKPRGRPRDVISFSAAITACQRLSKWQQAIHLLRTSLPDFKIAPDTLCFYGALWLPKNRQRYGENVLRNGSFDDSTVFIGSKCPITISQSKHSHFTLVVWVSQCLKNQTTTFPTDFPCLLASHARRFCPHVQMPRNGRRQETFFKRWCWKDWMITSVTPQ